MKYGKKTKRAHIPFFYDGQESACIFYPDFVFIFDCHLRHGCMLRRRIF